MAIAIARVPGADYISGNKRVKVRTLTFSGNYATDGETITAAAVGLKVIEFVDHCGIAQASDGATAIGVTFTLNAAGTACVVESYESGAANAALAEKTNAEAYPTGANIRVRFIGY